MWKFIIQNLLLLSSIGASLNYEESGVQKEVNEIEFAPDTQSINLRNKLDMMTEDLLRKGHGYVLSSGVGNREELGVMSVHQSKEFIVDKEVVEWQSIQSGGQVYLLGKRPTGFILLVSHNRHENETVKITQHTPDFPSGIEIIAMTLFERWNSTIKSNEVIILLAIKSSTADFLWYRLENNKVVCFWSWPHYKQVSTVLLFSIGCQHKMLTINTNSGNDSTTAEVYNIDFKQTHSDFTLTHTLALDETSHSAAISTVGEHVILFITQEQKGLVLLYKYKRFIPEQYENGHFELYTNLSAPGVTQLITFHTAYQNYIAFNGDKSQIFRITNSGELKMDKDFGYVRQWVALPVHTYRSEVVLFARHSVETKLYAWAGVDNSFSEISLPLCDVKLSDPSCFTGIKVGTASFLLHNVPNLIIPMHPDNPTIYQFITTLQPVKTPVYKIVNGLNAKINFLEDLWRKQKQNISDIRKSLQYVLRNDASNTVTGKWVLGNLTASNLAETSVLQCSKLGFLTKDTEEIYRYIDLDDLKNKITLIKKKISEMKDKIISAIDMSNFSGILSVKGETVIESLHVSTINQFSVNTLLHDTLRSDSPEKIVGTKIIRSLKANEITFSKIKNIPAQELTFSDKVVTVGGNLIIDKHLQVNSDVVLAENGTVNNLDLSRDICHVDTKCTDIGNPRFNNFIVDSINVHKKINGENLLPPINQSDTSEFNKVFGGHGLTVLNINGRNWLELANSVVYEDQDSYVAGDTIIQGVLYSKGDAKIEMLNGLRFPDDYAIISRQSQTITGRKTFPIQVPSKVAEQLTYRTHEETTETGASTGNEVMELESLLLDDFTDWLNNYDIIFTDLEVTGIVNSSMESNWTNMAADIVHKDEVNVDIKAQKTFIDSLTINNNLEVFGLVGNKNLSELLTTDTEQMLSGFTQLHGHITFNNVTVNGEWDGVRVEALFNDSVKLSDNEDLPDLHIVFMPDRTHESETAVGNLSVLHSLNNLTIEHIEETVKNYASLLAQPMMLNGSLYTTNLTVLHNITLKGKICGWNLTDYDSARFSLSKNENISGNVSILSAKVGEDLQTESINGMNVSDIQDYLTMERIKHKDVEITELHVHGNINSKRGISDHYNITDIAHHAVWLQSNNYINGSLTFLDEVTFGMMHVHGPVSNQDWDLFAQNVVYKSDIDVTFSGKKVFESGFSVDGNLDIDMINGHLFKEIVTKSSAQTIEGEVKITKDLIIEGNANISGTLNEADVTELSKRCKVLNNNEIKCEGNITFDADVTVQELQVTGTVNEEYKFLDFVNSVVYKNLPAQILGEMVFSGDMEVHGNAIIRSNMNNKNWNEFSDNVALLNETNDIKETVTFTKELNILNVLAVSGDLDAPTVNGYNLSHWVENVMYLDSPLHVSGTKCFTDIISKGDINIEWFDDVDMSSIITLYHTDPIMGTFNFKNVTVGNLEVNFKINDVRLEEEYENTLLSNGDQTVVSELTFLGDLSIKGNLTSSGLINKRNISNVATVYRNETLYGSYYFTCGIQLQNGLKTGEGIVSGVNITDWKKNAVLLDKDQTVEGPVTVMGNITFTQPISGATRLGATDLQELSQSIKRNILGVHNNMKDNLTKVCKETEQLVQRARAQDMYVQYFEQSQMIDRSDNTVLNVFNFQAYGDDFIAITGLDCAVDIYQWNKTVGEFIKVHAIDMSRQITHWTTLTHSNHTYIVTRSPALINDKCRYSGTNIWLFGNNNTIEHIFKMNENVEAVMTLGNKTNRFYTLDGISATEWEVNHTAGWIKLMKHKSWPNTLENATFVSPTSGLGLSITDGSKIVTLLPVDSLLVNISINCSSEKAEYSRDTQQHFIAVATSEETQIHRHSDFIKIYKEDGILFDKLTSWKPSHLNWLSLPGQSWLTFIENSTVLQIYNYKGPNEGFKQELSMNVNMTGLLTMSLHVADKLNAQPYILIYSNISVHLLQPKILGDPYIGTNVSCHYDDWYKID